MSRRGWAPGIPWTLSAFVMNRWRPPVTLPVISYRSRLNVTPPPTESAPRLVATETPQTWLRMS